MDSVVDPIPYLQSVKNQADQLKTQTGTSMTYEQYSELFLSDAITQDKKIKQDTKFRSKSRRSSMILNSFPMMGMRICLT